MADTITVTYKVNEDGSLSKIAKGAEKAAKSTDKATKASKNYNKGAKGVAGATSNGTKAFSKMRSEMGGSSGVVAAYATFAANVFALTAAFGALQRAAQLQNLEAGFERLGNVVGRTSSMMAASIQNITNGAISLDQAMRTAATGFAAGFSTAELESLAGVARGAATALGRDLPDSLDRLVRGTAKLEPEILDELGIFIKIDDAVRKYADSLGRSATSMTEVERRAAFLNEAISQGEAKFGAIADSVDVNTYDQLAANFDSLAKSALNLFSNILGPAVSFLASNTTALLGTLILFGSTLATSMFPALTGMADRQLKVAESTKKMADAAAGAAKKEAQRAKISFVREPSAAVKKDGTDFAAVKALKKGLKSGKQDAAMFDKALSQINSTMKKTATIAKKNDKLQDKEHKERMQQLERQKQKILEVQKAEAGRTGTSAKAGSLGTDAAGQKELAGALGTIGEGGAVEGFKTASAELGKFRATNKASMTELKASQGFISGMGTRLFSAFKLGGAGARLFGAALVNAIPVIGQIIFAVGLAIQMFTGLYKAITKPTKAEEQLAKVTENLAKKTEQLKETNEGLEGGFLKINLDKMIRDNVTLTDAMIDQAAASAKTSANIQAYANNLKVAAGVLDEFSASVGNLADEIAAQDSKGGMSAYLGNQTSALAGWFSDVGETIGTGVGTAAAGLGEAFSMWGEAISQTASDAAVAVGGVFVDGFAKDVENAGIDRQMAVFASDVSDSFSTIKEGLDKAGIGHLVENAFGDGKQTLDEYVKAQLGTVDSSKSVAEQTVQLAAAMKRVQGQVNIVSSRFAIMSSGINDFSENTKDGASALRTFALKAKESNEYVTLGENLQKVTNGVNALKASADASDGEFTFYDLLAEKARLGEIKLSDYGTTLDEVANAVDNGYDPFDELSTAIALAADEMVNGKARMAEMKAELKSLSAAFDITEKTNKFNDSMETLRKTGKFEQTGAQALERELASHEAKKQLIQDELGMNNKIAAQEVRMANLKLDVLALQNEGNSELLANIEEQRSALKDQLDTQKELNGQKAKSQTIDANSSFLTNQTSRVDSAASAAGQGDTTLERFTNFREGGGFKGLEKTDADGKKLEGESGENMLGKLEAMQSMSQPMIDNLKSLGPEGELVAAVTEGAFAMGSAFVAMSDTLSTSSSGMEKGAAIAQMAGQAFAQIGAIAAASSKAKIAGIDQEIAAEKKRDGKSAGSLAKIKAMEKKKEAIKRKEFETNKKMQMGQVVANTAAGIMGVMSGIKDPLITAPLALAQVAMIGAMGVAQLATISGTSFQGGGSIGSTGGGTPSKISIGQRNNTVDLAKSKSASGELAYMRGADGVGGAGNFRPAFSGYKHRAGGGYVVGEQGPELFMPEVPGEIISSGQNAGGLGNVSFNISTVDATGVEELLTGQKGNIIGMIRDAANSYGESFMDGVDTTVYNKTTEGVSRY